MRRMEMSDSDFGPVEGKALRRPDWRACLCVHSALNKLTAKKVQGLLRKQIKEEDERVKWVTDLGRDKATMKSQTSVYLYPASCHLHTQLKIKSLSHRLRKSTLCVGWPWLKICMCCKQQWLNISIKPLWLGNVYSLLHHGRQQLVLFFHILTLMLDIHTALFSFQNA